MIDDLTELSRGPELTQMRDGAVHTVQQRDTEPGEAVDLVVELDAVLERDDIGQGSGSVLVRRQAGEQRNLRLLDHLELGDDRRRGRCMLGPDHHHGIE